MHDNFTEVLHEGALWSYPYIDIMYLDYLSKHCDNIEHELNRNRRTKLSEEEKCVLRNELKWSNESLHRGTDEKSKCIYLISLPITIDGTMWLQTHIGQSTAKSFQDAAFKYIKKYFSTNYLGDERTLEEKIEWYSQMCCSFDVFFYGDISEEEITNIKTSTAKEIDEESYITKFKCVVI